VDLHLLIVLSTFRVYLSTAVSSFLLFFFFNAPATTEIYTLSLHDALPIYLVLNLDVRSAGVSYIRPVKSFPFGLHGYRRVASMRSEEHTSELQSRRDLVCRLLLEKKKKNIKHPQKN